MTKRLYCGKCFAKVRVEEGTRLIPHFKIIASGEARKCHGKHGFAKLPESVRVVSGGAPGSKR